MFRAFVIFSSFAISTPALANDFWNDPSPDNPASWFNKCEAQVGVSNVEIALGKIAEHTNYREGVSSVINALAKSLAQQKPGLTIVATKIDYTQEEPPYRFDRTLNMSLAIARLIHLERPNAYVARMMNQLLPPVTAASSEDHRRIDSPHFHSLFVDSFKPRPSHQADHSLKAAIEKVRVEMRESRGQDPKTGPKDVVYIDFLTAMGNYSSAYIEMDQDLIRVPKLISEGFARMAAPWRETDPHLVILIPLKIVENQMSAFSGIHTEQHIDPKTGLKALEPYPNSRLRHFMLNNGEYPIEVILAPKL